MRMYRATQPTTPGVLERVAVLVPVLVAVTTGVMVATGVAAAENVCEGVTTTFVGVTDGVTTGEREFDRVAAVVANCDAVTAGVAVLLGEAAAVPVTDVVTLGENVLDGVTPAVRDDTAVTFVLVADDVRVIVRVGDVEMVRVTERVVVDDCVLEDVVLAVTVFVGVCRFEGEIEGVCVRVRELVTVHVCVGVPVVVSELDMVGEAVEDSEAPRDSVAVSEADAGKRVDDAVTLPRDRVAVPVPEALGETCAKIGRASSARKRIRRARMAPSHSANTGGERA
jgi:hypothetical protein